MKATSRGILFFIVALTVLLSAGCAAVISDQSLRLVDPKLTFAEVRKNSQSYKGQYVLLGGAIVSVLNTNSGDEMEVVQFKTDDKGEITDTDKSGGRFLAVSSSFLDPAIYQPGLLVTIVGEVQGSRSMPLGEADYLYPLIGIREIHLWKPEEMRSPPQVHFGIGVGTIFH
ncbi:MAG TPA: Slp family lipoprotein [Negativicutes bacterium]|jgi:outer membrane lipoprotein